MSSVAVSTVTWFSMDDPPPHDTGLLVACRYGDRLRTFPARLDRAGLPTPQHIDALFAGDPVAWCYLPKPPDRLVKPGA